MASFLPNLGFYIGHCLNPADFDEYRVLSQIWAQAAAHFVRHPYVASVVADESMCSQIVDLLSIENISLDAHKVQHNLRPEMLASFGDPAAVLMLCIRYIRTAAIKKGYQHGLRADDTLASVLDAMYQLRAQKLSKEMPPSVSNVGTSPLSPYVDFARATMLIVKAASLSPEVHGNPPKPYSAKRSLWNTARVICAQAHASAKQASSQLTSLPEPGPLYADLHQARQMSSLTVQIVISVLRRHLKEASHEEHQPKEYMLVNCCVIMGAFLAATNSPVLRRLSQTVAQAIVSSGGLPLLMATLDHIKSAAKYAFPVLHHLVDTCTLAEEEVHANEAMVARMQGLRRFSTLLCPPYSEGQHDQLGRAKQAFEARSLGDVTHTVGHISFLSEVASVMVQLLACQPISHPAKGASKQQKAVRPSVSICGEDDRGWDLFPSGVLDAATPWPTPSVAQWAEIETISCRLLVLLEWAKDEQSYEGASLEEQGCLTQLRDSLMLLLHRLLLGHILDEALDFGRLARFGAVPILQEWILQPPENEVANELGFAFLRRMTIEPFTPIGNEPSPTQLSHIMRRVDGTVSVWSLLDPQHGAADSDTFNQLRTAAALEALHAAKFSKFDPVLLGSTPALTQDLHAAMHFMPKLGQRLTMCAVWAKTCFAELDPAELATVATVPAVSQHFKKIAHPHCLACAEHGVFQAAYGLLRLGLKEKSPSRTDEDLLGLARALTSVGKLLGVLPSTLPQLPVPVAQAVVDFLTTIPTATKSSGLQTSLLQACLLFIQALPKSMETGIKGLHKSMMQILHTCNRLTWCGLGEPLNCDVGLPPHDPPCLQPAVLEHILLHCPDHKSMWAEEPLARLSCALWMVDMMHFCLRHALQDGVDDSLKTHFYLEPCCLQFASFVPHLALIRQWTCHFEVLIPRPDSRSLSALAVHNHEGLPYQGALSKQLACAALQLLFLLLLKLKNRGADLTKLQLEKNKLPLIREQDRPLFSRKATAEFHDGLRELLSFLEVHLLPFVEKMRDSPLWEKKVCRVILDKCWCGQAESVFKECVQRLGGIISDALTLRITAAFRHPDDKTPVQLAGLDRLQKEGACKTEMQLARILAAHKAAMAYAQASEGEHPEGPKAKLGQEMAFGRLEDTAQKFAAARASSKAKPGQGASAAEGSTEGSTSEPQASSKAQLGGSPSASGLPAGGPLSETHATASSNTQSRQAVTASGDSVPGSQASSKSVASTRTQSEQSSLGGAAGGSTSGPHASSKAQPGRSAPAAGGSAGGSPAGLFRPKTVTIPLAGRTPYEAMQELMNMPTLPIPKDFWMDDPAADLAAHKREEELALAAAKKVEEQRKRAVAAKQEREEREQQQAVTAQQAADALLAEEELAAAQAAAKKAKKQRQKAKKQQEQQQQREKEEQLQQAMVIKQAQEAELQQQQQLQKQQQKQQQLQKQQAQQIHQAKNRQQQEKDQDLLHPANQQKQAQRPQRAEQAQHAVALLAAAADTAQQQQEVLQASTQQKQQSTINKAQHAQHAPALSATVIKPIAAAETASQAAHPPAQATATGGFAQALPSAFQAAGNGATATSSSTSVPSSLPTPLPHPLPNPLQPPALPGGQAKKPRAPAVLPPENPTAAPRAELGSTAPRAEKALSDFTHSSSSSAYEQQGHWDSQRHAQGGLQGVQYHEGTTAALAVGPISAQPQSSAEALRDSPTLRHCVSNGNGAAQRQDPGVTHSTPCSSGPHPKRLAHLWHLLCCPLTQELMVDPVIAADGFTYERSAIQAWLQTHDTSPVTNQRLLHSALLHNIAVSCAIDDEVL